jgi:hypothetical protein
MRSELPAHWPHARSHKAVIRQAARPLGVKPPQRNFYPGRANMVTNSLLGPVSSSPWKTHTHKSCVYLDWANRRKHVGLNLAGLLIISKEIVWAVVLSLCWFTSDYTTFELITRLGQLQLCFFGQVRQLFLQSNLEGFEARNSFSFAKTLATTKSATCKRSTGPTCNLSLFFCQIDVFKRWTFF